MLSDVQIVFNSLFTHFYSSSSSKRNMIEITNIVVQTSLNVIIQLKKAHNQIRDAKYNPKTFSAICWNHQKIGGTCLLFNNGKMICHMAKCMKDAHIIARLITVSALADISELVDLGIAHKYIPLSSWEPEIFNALVVK